MSKITYKENLGGSLTVFKQERSQYLQMSFYVSPYYTVNGKIKKNGMFIKSLKPITLIKKARIEARRIYKEFDFNKYDLNPTTTTFDDVAVKAYAIRKKEFIAKSKIKLKERLDNKTSADSEWTRYLKEIKPELGNIEITNRESLEHAIYDLVDRLRTHGNLEGKPVKENTITKYLNIIQVILKKAVADNFLNTTITNPPVSRRLNPRPRYRMWEVKKITDRTMLQYRRTEEKFFDECELYFQFLIAGTTRPGMETLCLKRSQFNLLTDFKDKLEIMNVSVPSTKTTDDFMYTLRPDFLRLHGHRLRNRLEVYASDDYFWFKECDTSRSTLNERIRKTFVRFAKEVDVYYFNGRERPLTSLRHMSQRMMVADGVDIATVAEVHNTSETMTKDVYLHETDNKHIIERHKKVFAKSIARIKNS